MILEWNDGGKSQLFTIDQGVSRLVQSVTGLTTTIITDTGVLRTGVDR